MVSLTKFNALGNLRPSLRMRRLFPDYGSLYNNSPSGIFQDMLEDYMERPNNNNSTTGAGLFGSAGIFSNYIE